MGNSRKPWKNWVNLVCFFSKAFFKYSFVIFRRRLQYEHFGTNYGGWKIPASIIKEIRYVISAGAGNDISFEVSFHQSNPHCMIWVLDPTEFGIQHLRKFERAVNQKKSILINDGKQRHPLDEKDLRYPLLEKSALEKIKFIPVGLSEKKEKLRFYFPPSDRMVSYSAKLKSDKFIELECESIQNLYTQLGISRLDVLKMDIEGSEYGVIKHMSDNKLFPKILLVEIHVFDIKQSIELIRTLFTLIVLGYRLYYVEGDNYGFVRK